MCMFSSLFHRTLSVPYLDAEKSHDDIQRGFNSSNKEANP